MKTFQDYINDARDVLNNLEACKTKKGYPGLEVVYRHAVKLTEIANQIKKAVNYGEDKNASSSEIEKRVDLYDMGFTSGAAKVGEIIYYKNKAVPEINASESHYHHAYEEQFAFLVSGSEIAAQANAEIRRYSSLMLTPVRNVEPDRPVLYSLLTKYGCSKPRF